MLTFLLKLLLCLILVNVIHCSLGFILDDLRRTSELECIYNSGYEYSVYYALSSSQGINENSTDALNNVKNANLRAEVVYVPCRGRSPQLQVQDFMKIIPKQLYQTVWFYANEDSQDQECKWDQQNLQQNVRIMIDFVTEFKKNGLNIGFLAGEQYWQSMFGGCLLFKDFPLFWFPEIPNNTPSFEDFRGFADWKAPKQKLWKLEGSICGSGYSLCYEQ